MLMDDVPELKRESTTSSLEKTKDAGSLYPDQEKVDVTEAPADNDDEPDVKVIEKAQDVAVEVST